MAALSSQLLDRAQAAYLGLAIGDALGATTEFMTVREIECAHGKHKDIVGGGWLKLQPGQVTDDTEMTLALGQAIVDEQSIKAPAIAEAFSEWMRSKPADIGHTVRRGISHYRQTGRPFVEPNEHDAGNGACMRCLPIALACHNDNDAVLSEASKLQAHITHNTEVADAGTETVLRMIVAALHEAALPELRMFADELVSEYPEFRFDKKRVENPCGWIVETLRTVFQAIFENDSFEDTLVDVVNRGGDADTTGAIAGMIVGAYYGTEAIPTRWWNKLPPEIYTQCLQQAEELLSLAEKPEIELSAEKLNGGI